MESKVVNVTYSPESTILFSSLSDWSQQGISIILARLQITTGL